MQRILVGDHRSAVDMVAVPRQLRGREPPGLNGATARYPARRISQLIGRVGPVDADQKTVIQSCLMLAIARVSDSVRVRESSAPVV